MATNQNLLDGLVGLKAEHN